MRVHACGICGSDIHQLRDGWGFKPGAVAGHEWSGTDRRRRRRRHQLVGRRAGRGRRVPEVRHLPPLPRGQAVAVREPAEHDGRAQRRRLRRVHPRAGGRCAAAARGPARRGTPPWPNRCRWPCTASPARASQPGDTVMVFGAGPIGALSVAALHVDGHHGHHRGRAPRGPAPPGRRPRCRPPSWTRPTSRSFASWEPERMSSRAVHVVLECSGHRAAIEAGFSSWRAAASW